MKTALVLHTMESKAAAGPAVGIGLKNPRSGSGEWLLLTSPCESYDAFVLEVEKLKSILNDLLGEAKNAFSGVSGGKRPEDLWAWLEQSPDENSMISRFNGLEESVRGDLADYVFRTQNIFKGYASVFSVRYREDASLLE